MRTQCHQVFPSPSPSGATVVLFINSVVEIVEVAVVVVVLLGVVVVVVVVVSAHSQ